MEKTMTVREFYEAVVAANISDTLTDKAHELIAALDAKNAKRRSTDTKEKKEAAARRGTVLAFLRSNEGAFTRDEIAENVGLKPSEVTGACTILCKDGVVEKTEVKIDKARRVAYAAVTVTV